MDVYIRDPAIREGIIKGKMYRVFALLFFAVGFLVFIILYNGFMENRSFKDIFSFTIVFIIAMPFLPALALSWVAMKTERKTDIDIAAYFAEEERKKIEAAKAIEAKIRAAKAAQDGEGEDGGYEEDEGEGEGSLVSDAAPAVETSVSEPQAAKEEVA
tara:strand:+ start:289758 stop:290231 length:474 start_codon:yes stop_codon:yes gene_type:complete